MAKNTNAHRNGLCRPNPGSNTRLPNVELMCERCWMPLQKQTAEKIGKCPRCGKKIDKKKLK